MALLQNVLPHQFIAEKVKIVEAVYFANILNQSCFEFLRHQKAASLNEPVLAQHWRSLRSRATHNIFIHLFTHPTLIEGGLAIGYTTQLWRHKSEQNTVSGLKI